MTAILKVDQLRGGYGSTEVIHGLSFELRRGQVFSLIGKNGMGKSTLLKLLLGLLAPTSGRITFDGSNVAGETPNAIIARSVAYVPQDHALFQDLTVEQNLRLGALAIPKADFQERIRTSFSYFPFLRDRLKQKAGTLSGGEQKMLLLARALIPRPKLVLIDEVSEGVQPMVVQRMGEVLSNAARVDGMSILLVEQNIEFALGLSDRFGVINQGNLVEQGDPTEAGVRQKAEAHLTI